MDEGIVTLEGVYVVRYFVGGSGCCVAESKEFQVLINPKQVGVLRK